MKDNEKILKAIGEIDEELIPFITEGTAHKGSSTRRKIAVFGSVCAAALVLGFCSVGGVVAAGKLNRSITEYYEELPDENYIDYLFNVNKVVTDHGYTVEVQNGFCDGYTLFLIVKEEITDENEYFSNVYIDKEQNEQETLKELKELWTSGAYHEFMTMRYNLNNPYSGEPEDTGGTQFIRVLEKTDHSVTVLRGFGGGAYSSSKLFKDGQVTLEIETPFLIDEYPYTKVLDYIQIPIDIKVNDDKIITQYSLSKGSYRYDESIKIGDNIRQEYADISITPWFANITNAMVKGKRLDIDRPKDVPFVEITLQNGRTYTERNGIHLEYQWGEKETGADMFGKDYDIRQDIVMTFDKPIDITSIKSFKINGVETCPVM